MKMKQTFSLKFHGSETVTRVEDCWSAAALSEDLENTVLPLKIDKKGI